jgi:hypothetical protein
VLLGSADDKLACFYKLELRLGGQWERQFGNLFIPNLLPVLVHMRGHQSTPSQGREIDFRPRGVLAPRPHHRQRQDSQSGLRGGIGPPRGET